MHRNILTATVLAAIFLGTNDMAVEANHVTYKMRVTPTDPSSAITFVVNLALESVGADGAWVGWKITSAEFRRPGNAGGPDTVWVAAFPFVDSSDGLWWIEHADPSAPKLSEFLMPPWLFGTASAQDPSDPELDYSFKGVPYVPPPEGRPFATTAALSHEFILQAGGTTDPPPPPDDDEPVEPGGTLPPES